MDDDCYAEDFVAGVCLNCGHEEHDHRVVLKEDESRYWFECVICHPAQAESHE